jgi:RNA polymerase sigma factor (sigma-70 family)
LQAGVTAVRLSYEARLEAHGAGGLLDKLEFMRACREGGAAIERALRALDRSLFANLYAYSLRSLRDPEVARDLVQDTFIRVWQRCSTYQGDSDLERWVKAILRNAIFDRLRRPAREVPLDDGAAASAEVTERIFELSKARVSTPPDEARRAQLAECFQRCWARFERACPDHAAVIAWIVDDGLSNEEIASLLERSPGATREFISQCRKRARIHLAEWYAMVFETDAVT